MDSIIKPPIGFNCNGNVALNWQVWRKLFETNILAIGGEELNEKRKCALLLHIIGESVVEIYETFPVKHETLREILDQFENYFVPKVNVTYERHKFFMCCQETNMTMDE